MASPGSDLSDEVVRALELGIDDIQLTLKCLPLLGHNQSLLGPSLVLQPEIGDLPSIAASSRRSGAVVNEADPVAVSDNGARRQLPVSRTSRSLRAKASGWPA